MTENDRTGVYRTCAKLYALALLVITLILAAAMLAAPVMGMLIERTFLVRIFDMSQWLDCCRTIGLAALVTLYAPLVSVMAVYWRRSRKKSDSKNTEEEG